VESGLKLAGAAFISAVAFLAFVMASYLFSSITPDIDDRTLSPLLPLALLFLAAVLFTAPRAFGLRWFFQLVPLAILVVAGQFYYRQTRSLSMDRVPDTRGYAAPRWRSSELMQVARTLPSGQALITNSPIPVLLFTDRAMYAVQELENGGLQATTLRYGDGSDPAQALFRQGNAALIIFQPDLVKQMTDLYGASGPQRAEALLSGLKLTRQVKDGAIYTYP
jgi:hypothetical protein